MSSSGEASGPLSKRSVGIAALVAASTTALLYAWVGDTHCNWAEEGYLWYGTLRTAAGELPLRDFQSYDPGRYLWCALLGRLLGHDLIGLRLCVAVFQALGVFFGLLAARRALCCDAALVPAALFLQAWMFPRHKLFESALAATAVWVGVRLLERPTPRRFLEAGAYAGLAAFFGRNHGLYVALGGLLLIGVLQLRLHPRPGIRSLGAWAGGVVLGYSPMLVLLAFAPGFAARFLESLALLLKLGSNIPSPWRYPWDFDWSPVGFWGWVESAGGAFAYALPWVVLPVGLLTLLRTPAQSLARGALLLSGAAFGIFYIHHAAVRSDPSHLAQAIDPVLLGAIGLPAAFGWRRRVPLALGWCLVALLNLGAVSSFHQLLSRNRLAALPALVPYEVGGGRPVRIEPSLADYLDRLQGTVASLVPADAGLFIGPSRPGFYPLLAKKSPTWWIYFFVPDVDETQQRRVIQDLRSVDWALIVDVAIARQERFLFRNTNPLVWRSLMAEFERVPTPRLPPNHLLLRRKEPR